jgi:transposase, IS5 family
LKAGTIVDATIIHAPPSTKNAKKTRDPEMRQTKKGQQWHFGMKLHVGTDTRGTVHSVTGTDAAQAEINQLPALLHGKETTLYGDRAYWREYHRQCARQVGVRYRVNRRAKCGQPLTEHQKTINASRSKVRARGEHAFHVAKHLWGHAKVRYRGLAKNLAQAFTLFALANLYRLRRFLPRQNRCVQ